MAASMTRCATSDRSDRASGAGRGRSDQPSSLRFWASNSSREMRPRSSRPSSFSSWVATSVGAAAGWPDGGRLASAAVNAVRDPNTWIPAAGALIFGLTDLDDEVSEYAIDHAPVFGSDAGSASDDLRDIAVASYVLTALVAPSDSTGSRATGFLVGGATLMADRVLVDGLKRATDRERPDGSNNRSWPSGHTSLAATSASMAAGNLAYVDMPAWARVTANVGLFGTAAATGWARVEAGKHFPSDVLAGYALGSFLARFAYGAFLESGEASPPLSISLAPLPGGGVIAVSMPVP